MIKGDVIHKRDNLALQFKMIRIRAERARDLANSAVATANRRIGELNDEIRQYNNLCGTAGQFTSLVAREMYLPANDVTTPVQQAFDQFKDEWKLAEFVRLEDVHEIPQVTGPIFDGEEILEQLPTEPDL